MARLSGLTARGGSAVPAPEFRRVAHAARRENLAAGA